MDVDRITVARVQDGNAAGQEVVFLDARNPQGWERARWETWVDAGRPVAPKRAE